MAAHVYDEIAAHVNHNIECVGYGVRTEDVVIDGEIVAVTRVYANAAIECTDCNVVLLDFDNPDY